MFADAPTSLEAVAALAGHVSSAAADSFGGYVAAADSFGGYVAAADSFSVDMLQPPAALMPTESAADSFDAVRVSRRRV